ARDGDVDRGARGARAAPLGPGAAGGMAGGGGLPHPGGRGGPSGRAGGGRPGFQPGATLPRRDKLMPPRYQEIPAAGIPVGRSDDGRVEVRVLAGEALGARAVIDTRTPIVYLHYTLQPGARTVQPVPAALTALAYVF